MAPVAICSASSQRPSAHSGSAWLIASTAARGAGQQLGVRTHRGAAGRLGCPFVLPGPLEQVGLVDRRVQQHFFGAAALGHGAGLGDQVEGTAVRGCLLAGVGVEHGQRQQRVRLFRLVAGCWASASASSA